VRKSAGQDPEIPEGISAGLLDKAVRHELSGLSREVAVQTGAHLAAANYFIESDPERAWEHAVAARRRGSRLGVVRETAGLAAYRTGRYADALAELRTARRITGSNEHLPVMADCERGLGRPERALELTRGPEARTLDADGRIELRIVESGARADLGEYEAAVVVLQIPELDSNRRSPSLARLRFAYSEALKQAKRHQEAQTWRQRALAEDPDGSAGVNEPVDDDLEVVDLEWDDEQDQDLVVDDPGSAAADRADEPDDDVHGGAAAVEGPSGRADGEGHSDAEHDEDSDGSQDEDEDEDRDELDDDDDELDDEDELGEDELELGSDPAAASASGSAFEMRFAHGGRDGEGPDDTRS